MTSTNTKIRTRSAWIGLVVALVTLMSTGCSGSNVVPKSQPLPGDSNFQGVWYSPQFERMFLTQEGDEVTGVYTYENGGRIEGTADGNVLTFNWKDAGNKQTATKQMSGKGYFQLVKTEQGLELTGQWGYDEQRDDGGPWEAEYIRELEPDDPTTLDELDN
jgi:hypothetical protein